MNNEYQKSILENAVEGAGSVAKLADKMSVHSSTIYRWQQALARGEFISYIIECALLYNTDEFDHVEHGG